MNKTAEILFEYLRDVLYKPFEAALDLDKIDSDFTDLGMGLMFFAQCHTQTLELASGLAKGDLSIPLPPPENELAAPLKSLHASLKHLTWQSQQVAKGDYGQRVDFMGEFSSAFNTMIEQLAERQQKLENEIEMSRKKTKALEQSNQLLTNITQQIKQQIVVVDRESLEVLFMNGSARREVENDAEYINRLTVHMSADDQVGDGQVFETQYDCGGEDRYLSVSAYFLEWNKASAEAFVVNDISAEKSQIKELETHAYRDPMTNLYNRFFGMHTLNNWLSEKRRFVLVFADLDNLKYINDQFGHTEGDMYITTAAKHLRNIAPDIIISRIGGDEFMLLIPNMEYDEANTRVHNVCLRVQNDEYLAGKKYFYSVSFGIVYVDGQDELLAADILGIADERMYAHKRSRKKNRQ